MCNSADIKVCKLENSPTHHFSTSPDDFYRQNWPFLLLDTSLNVQLCQHSLFLSLNFSLKHYPCKYTEGYSKLSSQNTKTEEQNRLSIFRNCGTKCCTKMEDTKAHLCVICGYSIKELKSQTALVLPEVLTDQI